MQTALLFTVVFRFVLGGLGGGRVSTSLSTSDELTPTEAVGDEEDGMLFSDGKDNSSEPVILTATSG